MTRPFAALELRHFAEQALGRRVKPGRKFKRGDPIERFAKPVNRIVLARPGAVTARVLHFELKGQVHFFTGLQTVGIADTASQGATAGV